MFWNIKQKQISNYRAGVALILGIHLFTPLYDSISSLKGCLIALQRGKFEREEVEEAKKILGKILLNYYGTVNLVYFP